MRWAPSRAGRRGGIALILGTFALLGSLATATGALTASAAPDLRPVIPSINPAPAFEGDVVGVSVFIMNEGDMTATAASIDVVDLRPGGASVSIGQAELQSPLAPGASVAVDVPRFVAAGVGSHTLTIRVENVTPPEAQAGGGEISISFEVLPAQVTPPHPAPTDGIHIEALGTLGVGALVGFVVVILAIGVAVAALDRRASRELEPPPPEPPDRSPPPLWPP